MNRRLLVSAPVGAVLAAAGVVAFAAFTSPGSGTASAGATTMPPGSTPGATVSARDVALTWSQASMGNGTAVSGYSFKRYPAAGGSAVSVGASCSGTVAAQACTESAVAPGSWKYTVTPVQGAWHGTESALSSAVTVASPSVSLTASTLAPAQSTTATIGNFVDGDAVTFHLGSAGGTAIGTATASSTPGSNGGGSGTVTIPGGTTSGTYTVYAVGASGDQASTAVVVDGTPPSVSATVIASASSGTAGFVGPGAQYYVYANASDTGGSGIASVSANVNNITSGQTAVALVSGSYTVGSTAYGFRSGALTAGGGLTSGSKSYSVSATDGAGNGSAAFAGSVTVDTTVPTVSAVAIAPISITTTPGFIAQGGSFYVYANAADTGSGLAAVTTNVNSLTSGTPTATLVAGTYSAFGNTYSYRSGALVAKSTLAQASYSYTVAASDNAGNTSSTSTGSVTVDDTKPSVNSLALAHTSNTTSSGLLAQGASYYVYASVTEAGSGLASLTADLSHLTTGQTAATFTPGTYSAFGQTFNYRSGPLTADNPLTGAPAYTVSASDNAANVATPVQQQVTMDNTAPTVTTITSSNNSGTVDVGDTFSVTFSEAIDPGTVDQTADAATVTFDQNANNDITMAIEGLMAASDTGITKATGGWVKTAKTITYPGTLTFSNANKTITLTISGACSSSSCTQSAAGSAGTLTYQPDSSATSPYKLNDYAGNAVTGTKTYPSTGTIKVF
jgi:hypothetical protein